MIDKKGGNIYDGVNDTIKYLSKKYKLAIVTNNTDGYAKLFLNKSGLKDYFEDCFEDLRYELEGKLLTYLMRCRTTRLEKQLEGTPLVRCHRSFIVNVDNVKLFKREGARVFLVLTHPDAKKIPVSKSYYKTIAERLGRIAS